MCRVHPEGSHKSNASQSHRRRNSQRVAGLHAIRTRKHRRVHTPSSTAYITNAVHKVVAGNVKITNTHRNRLEFHRSITVRQILSASISPGGDLFRSIIDGCTINFSIESRRMAKSMISPVGMWLISMLSRHGNSAK